MNHSSTHYWKLFEDERPTLLRQALTLTGGNEDDAEDLVQDTALKGFGRLNESKSASFGVWIYGVMLSVYVDKVRQDTLMPTCSLEELVLDVGIDPMAVDDANELDMPDLNEPDLEVLPAVLHRETLKACSLRTGLSVPAVKSRVFRLRGMLRLALAGQVS